jgi:Big-like domain-containing protein/calcineurin-like phosphoesterase family protein
MRRPRRLRWLSNASLLTVSLVLSGLLSCAKSSDKITSPKEPVASVVVDPPVATTLAGGSASLTARPENANNDPLSGRVVTWSSDNTVAATVSGSGLVTGVVVGSATVTATCEGKSGTSAILVTPPGPAMVLVGAGDIAQGGREEATAKLLDNIPGTVFTAGDNAYNDGSAAQYAQLYGPTWGRHKARTLPCPGNHDYHTAGAAGYFNYFGAFAGPAGRGYYSYDLGDWHIISLDSEIDVSAGSAQERWLRADLAASTKSCTIAYWHRPRFSSGTGHGSASDMAPLWQALQDAGAEIVVCGHDHDYERFAPQTANGTADPARGIREFVVGTGGAGLYSIVTPIANSEAHSDTTFGVLKLTLGSGTYSWQFIPIAGQTFTDSGSGVCH